MPLVRAHSKSMTPEIYSWVCCRLHGFGKITIKTGKLDNFELMLPFPTDSSCTDLFKFKYFSEVLNLCLYFNSCPHTQ